MKAAILIVCVATRILDPPLLYSGQVGEIRVGVGVFPRQPPSVPGDVVLHADQSGGIGSLAFNPKGDRLVSGTSGATPDSVKLWDLRKANSFQTLKGREDYTRGLAFSPDGRYLAASGRTIRVLDARSGVVIKEITMTSRFATFVAFSRDGTRLAIAGDTVELWNWRAERRIYSVTPSAQSSAILYNPKGDLIAVAVTSPMSNAVEIRNAKSGALIRKLTLSSGQPHAIAFSPNGRLIAIGTRTPILVDRSSGRMSPIANNAATVSVWNVADGRQQRSISVGDWTSGLAFTRRGDFLIAASGIFQQTGRAITLNLRSGEVSTLIPAISAHETAVFSPDRSWLAASDGSEALGLWKVPKVDERR